MLINLRNALMAGKRLPYDAEIEFLESTGTQWIDTGVEGNASASLVIECTFLQKQPSGTAGFIFGSRSGANKRFGFAVVPRGDVGNYTFGYRSDHAYNVALSSNFETVRFVATPTVAECTFRGTTLTASDAPLDTNLNIYIFTRNFSGSIGQNFEGCLASLKIYSNGTLVRDFIPVRKGTAGYLYDRVSGKLFGNAGTGDFVVGQDVVPVEYIESHGAEWIDTGVKLSPSYEYDIDFNILRDKGTTQTVSSTYNSWNRNSPMFLLGLSTYFGGRLIIVGKAGLAAGSGVNVGWIYGQRVAMSLRGSTITYNGTNYEFTRFEDATAKANYDQPLFGALRTSASEFAEMRLWHCDIWADGTTLSRKFRPIRVGTDATSWEGAMMDTLTRRIYRNAGTGAFGYGNDLKYPIPAS